LYEVVEVGLASSRRLLAYKRTGRGADDGFGLKTFDHLWIESSRAWSRTERVLDVGPGYSSFPAYLAGKYGCEVWGVDDFGLETADHFWKRGRNPNDLVKAQPSVRYVFERVGDPGASSLPAGNFDCVYSASTLEHVSAEDIGNVWRHMDRLLKPGGAMVHAIDMVIPGHRGALSLLKAWALDRFAGVLPASYRVKNTYFTPRSYLRVVRTVLGHPRGLDSRQFSTLRMALDPDVLLEPLDWAFHRMTKDRMDDIPLLRVTSLLIHVKKTSA
jgi:SAM-dependent methyltransferase